MKNKDKVLVEGRILSKTGNGNIVEFVDSMDSVHGEKKPTLLIDDRFIHPCTEPQWVPIEKWKGTEEKKVLVTIMELDGSLRVGMVQCIEKSLGSFELSIADSLKVIAVMDSPKPYQPQATLPESCEYCEFKRGYGTVFDQHGATEYVQFCKAADDFVEGPHMVNGKPCNEA